MQAELNSPDFKFESYVREHGQSHVVIFDAPQAQDSLSELKFSSSLKNLSVQVQQHKLFPEGVNVEWCRAVSRNEVHSLIYERGCGVTLACAKWCRGSSCRRRPGRAESIAQQRFRLPGGYLSIEWKQADDHVHMSGPAADKFQRINW